MTGVEAFALFYAFLVLVVFPIVLIASLFKGEAIGWVVLSILALGFWVWPQVLIDTVKPLGWAWCKTTEQWSSLKEHSGLPKCWGPEQFAPWSERGSKQAAP